ncbi:hypothetical protein L1887_16213 [Cichorium endivia]|nr:hypothetical protein L1887_16213 [Cichorium endivia]
MSDVSFHVLLLLSDFFFNLHRLFSNEVSQTRIPNFLRLHYAVSSIKIHHTGDFTRIGREDLGFLVISADDHGNIHFIEVPGFHHVKKVPESILISYIGKYSVRKATIESILKRTLPHAMSSVDERALKDSIHITSTFPEMEKTYSYLNILKIEFDDQRVKEDDRDMLLPNRKIVIKTMFEEKASEHYSAENSNAVKSRDGVDRKTYLRFITKCWKTWEEVFPNRNVECDKGDF